MHETYYLPILIINITDEDKRGLGVVESLLKGENRFSWRIDTGLSFYV
ncbi:MAG: hypothetical protein AAFR66_22975 [Bacteroidota bacterium]